MQTIIDDNIQSTKCLLSVKDKDIRNKLTLIDEYNHTNFLYKITIHFQHHSCKKSRFVEKLPNNLAVHKSYDPEGMWNKSIPALFRALAGGWKLSTHIIAQCHFYYSHPLFHNKTNRKIIIWTFYNPITCPLGSTVSVNLTQKPMGVLTCKCS